MTKKDYIELSKLVAGLPISGRGNEYHTGHKRDLANRLADVCAEDNPRFDRDRFLIACGVPR